MAKKNIIFLSASLILIILLGIGVSYSMWNITTSQDTENTAYTECFDLSITNKENNISLNNAYPISNDKGKSLPPYTFTITNTCDITTQYNINLEVLNSSTLSSKFIDVMFEGNINLLSSYDATDKVNTSSIESRKLTTGILKSQESKDYSLRLWIDYNTTLEDLNNEIKSFKSKIVVVGKPISYTGDTVFSFDYTGGEQNFVAPVSGTYKIETWGAQGGGWGTGANLITGGVGGYSVGNVVLQTNATLFINIGGKAKSLGTGIKGGEATYIATKSGLLSTLENSKKNIIIVSGGGGGSEWVDGQGGSGGGYIGNNGENKSNIVTGGTQTSGGKSANILSHSETTIIYDGCFGLGGYSADGDGGGEGGDGYYGGGASSWGYGGGGGSGYIGNSLLTSKAMYCYNCEESNEESTKTISTTCNDETPTSYCAKKGNGYARITLVSIDE